MAIYYCSWATGNDTTGDGTAILPGKTITKASTSRTAGDEVRVAKSPEPTALTGTTAWTLNGAEDEPIYEVIIILAACNIYQIEQENRNLLIENENRIFAIDEEQRDYSIPFEDRIYKVSC